MGPLIFLCTTAWVIFRSESKLQKHHRHQVIEFSAVYWEANVRMLCWSWRQGKWKNDLPNRLHQTDRARLRDGCLFVTPTTKEWIIGVKLGRRKVPSREEIAASNAQKQRSYPCRFEEQSRLCRNSVFHALLTCICISPIYPVLTNTRERWF